MVKFKLRKNNINKYNKFVFFTDITKKNLRFLINYCKDQGINVDNIKNIEENIKSVYFDFNVKELNNDLDSLIVYDEKYGDQKMTIKEFIESYEAYKKGDYEEIWV